jgi:hypothetical protein
MPEAQPDSEAVATLGASALWRPYFNLFPLKGRVACSLFPVKEFPCELSKGKGKRGKGKGEYTNRFLFTPAPYPL